MFFIEEFDLKDGIEEKDFIEVWESLTAWWHNNCDTIKLVHFSKRAFGLGPLPVYLAIWETPNFASMDNWKRLLEKDPKGTSLEKRFSSMITNVTSKVTFNLLKVE